MIANVICWIDWYPTNLFFITFANLYATLSVASVFDKLLSDTASRKNTLETKEQFNSMCGL